MGDKVKQPAQKKAKVDESLAEAKHADADENVMSVEEVRLYDRQIRLWGMEAQTKYLQAFTL